MGYCPLRLAVIKANVDRARQVVDHAARLMAEREPITAAGAMAHSLITAGDAISADARRRLDLLIRDQLG